MRPDDRSLVDGPWRLQDVASGLVSLGTIIVYAAAFARPPQLVYGLLCWGFGGFLCCLIHEIGHLVAALSCRWRIIVVAVRPFAFHVPNRELAFVARSLHEEDAGWVVSVPRSAEKDTEKRWRTILISGPAANGALALAAALASFSLPVSGVVNLARLALALTLQSCHRGALSLLPANPPHLSDGSRLRALGHPRTAYAVDRPALWLMTLLTHNMRLATLPSWLLERARRWPALSDEMKRFMATVEIGIVLDRSPVDTATARRLIERFRRLYGTNAWLAACDAYLAAVWEGKADGPDPVPAGAAAEHIVALTLAAEAAVAARRGQADEARRRLDEMDRALKPASPFKDATFRDIRRQVEALL